MMIALRQLKSASASVAVLLCFMLARAQPGNTQSSGVQIFNAPPPPEDIEAPGDRVGGGKRDCQNIQQPTTSSKEALTALVPVYKLTDRELVLGLTTKSHPTFWFYVPYTSTVTAEFVIQNQAGQSIYKSPISLSGTPGVVSLTLPSSASLLEIGKRYHWYFNVYCNSQQPPVFVDGWIARVIPNLALQSQLLAAPPKQRAAIYASHGIWYEALTAAAEVHRIDPEHSQWAVMLQAVGLNNIASEPVVDCCTLPFKAFDYNQLPSST